VASNTLVANIQIVMPGEIARAHRHSAAALRLIIEGRGGYTVVNGERVPMFPGDLVLAPNWSLARPTKALSLYRDETRS
jgi:gentisate 1,2-dioxygenase